MDHRHQLGRRWRLLRGKIRGSLIPFYSCPRRPDVHFSVISVNKNQFSPTGRRDTRYTMTGEIKKQTHDSSLGMNRGDISPRLHECNPARLGQRVVERTDPAPVASPTGKEGWTGYGGTGDYAESNGNTFEVMGAGHEIRDHLFDNPPQSAEDTGETLMLLSSVAV